MAPAARTTPWKLLATLICSIVLLHRDAMEQPPRVLTTASSETWLLPEEAVFATFYYDHGEDSDALFLAARVMMKLIKESNTVFRKLVLAPEDGINATKAQILNQDDPEIEILLHMRNKLVIWDDPVIFKLKHAVYLDPENLVLRNLDEIFACTQFCAVTNGQSVVCSNSLLVISHKSIVARNLYSDPIDSSMVSGREYNYVGVTQGFLPDLFEAFEESPLFYFDDDIDTGIDEGSSLSSLPTPKSDSVVHRLLLYP